MKGENRTRERQLDTWYAAASRLDDDDKTTSHSSTEILRPQVCIFPVLKAYWDQIHITDSCRLAQGLDKEAWSSKLFGKDDLQVYLHYKAL